MNRFQQSFVWCLLICGLFVHESHSLEAAEWGSLSGKFVYTGKPVKQKQGPFPVDESLVIGPQGGIKNIFVFLKGRNLKQEQIHPDFQKLPNQVEIQHLGNRIQPHAVGLWQPHQKLVVLNKDPDLHLTHLHPLINRLPDSIQENIDRKKIIRFEHPELLPMQIKCDIHPWETGYLLVQSHPYFALTDETGTFQIKNLPVGEWEFRIWHEKVGYLAAREEWQKGRIKEQIKPGKNDLGVIKVSPEMLQTKTSSKQ
ncbi:hypothetical protein Pan153_33190 [Gimesia panareensis]|uniref:Rhamnogalacturonan lyase domain-containing protein n=1 Tax=Gimesia panareensis TaxID=2527978 RepID=A0A518FQN5_9PLAN|nr:hypothetical protein [Gimesia panareensis]QDV18659.1 hypothetical protein Pan153_33190 [Gimesia panareensis]